VIEVFFLTGTSVLGFFIGYNLIKSLPKEDNDAGDDIKFQEELVFRDEEILLPEDLKNSFSCELEFSK
jgi:hypothetical protein